VAVALLRNAEVAANFVLPFCQDTGTATIVGKKGQQVWTGARDEEYLSKGVHKTYTEENLRYSQTIPLDMYEEINSGTNLPAQIDLYATEGMEYKFLFVAKGGGSANKTYLFQETKALLNPASLEKFLVEKMKTLGPRRARRTTSRSSSAGRRPRRRSKPSNSPPPATSTTFRQRGTRGGGRSATSRWRGSSSPPRARPDMERSSAGSISRTMSGSSGCRATARRARSRWASPARPTGT